MAIKRLGPALLALAAFSCGGEEERVVVDETTGAVVERTGWRGFRRHGLWELNYADGSPKVRGRFEEGRRTGEWTWYHPGGIPHRRGRFQDTLAVGPWTEWHPNGTKSAEGHYEGGDRHGSWQAWDTDGHPAATAQWDAGTLVKIEQATAAGEN